MSPAPGGIAPKWNDPAAFAATSPPPTTDEQEAKARGGPPPEPTAAPQRPTGRPQAGESSVEQKAPATGASRTEAQVGKDPLSLGPDAPRVLAGFLVSYEANELGAFWPIYQGKNVVGRKGAADGLDIEIDHPTTSSRHAFVHASARPGVFKIEDPGSTNGTYLNEERLPKATPQEVRDGDAVRFGGFTVTVKIV
jgi:hypothetical protein